MAAYPPLPFNTSQCHFVYPGVVPQPYWALIAEVFWWQLVLGPIGEFLRQFYRRCIRCRAAPLRVGWFQNDNMEAQTFSTVFSAFFLASNQAMLMEGPDIKARRQRCANIRSESDAKRALITQ